MARLLYNDRSGRQQVLQLDPSRGQVVLGRQSDCAIIVHDTSVSRRHCIITPEDGGFVVVDLGSANGTLVNDVRITRRRLADNDVIRCGIYAVRFIEAREAMDPAQMNLRDRYRQRSENAGRAAAERLQALNVQQAQRLVQLQDELVRLDGERHAALERSARHEGELLAAREQLREMQGHLRHLAAALQHREAELAAARSGAGVRPTAPPAPPPAGSGSSMGQAALASANHALRAEIAQLESALAAEYAFVRASAIVPAADRWRAVEVHQRAAREAEATVERLERALERSPVPAQETAPSARLVAEARIAELEDAARVAERGRRDAERARRDAEARAAAAEAKAKAAARRAVPLATGIGQIGMGGAARASVFGQLAPPKTGFLSGLGGLGRTAGGASEASPGARLPGESRAGGHQGSPGQSAADRGRSDPWIRETEAVVDRLTRAREAAREKASVLVGRLEAARGADGLSALQVAECLDLAGTIRDTLRDDTPE